MTYNRALVSVLGWHLQPFILLTSGKSQLQKQLNDESSKSGNELPRRHLQSLRLVQQRPAADVGEQPLQPRLHARRGVVLSLTLTRATAPWAYARGEPFRTIAALELLGTLVSLVVLVPEVNRRGDAAALITMSW